MGPLDSVEQRQGELTVDPARDGEVQGTFPCARIDTLLELNLECLNNPCVGGTYNGK